MVLYSDAGMALLSVTPAQMETIIIESLVWTNAALSNSLVAATFNLVHVGLVRASKMPTNHTISCITPLWSLVAATFPGSAGKVFCVLCTWGFRWQQHTRQSSESSVRPRCQRSEPRRDRPTRSFASPLPPDTSGK